MLMNRLYCILGIAKHRFQSKEISKVCPKKAATQLSINQPFYKYLRLQSWEHVHLSLFCFVPEQYPKIFKQTDLNKVKRV